MTIIPSLDWLHDMDRIETVISWLRASGLEEFEQSDAQGRRISVRLTPQKHIIPSSHSVNPDVTHGEEPRLMVSAPYFGTLHLTAPYSGVRSCHVGDTIELGDIMAWLVQGSLVVPVKATVSGTVLSVLKDNNALVGYGEHLFEIERTSISV